MVNQNSQLKSNKIYIELSERSLDLYKAYAESKNEAKQPRVPILQVKKQESSYSLNTATDPAAAASTNTNNSNSGGSKSVSNTSMFRPPEWRQFSTTSDYAKFFDLDELNSSPFKYLSEANLSVYSNFLDVGFGGAKEPAEKSLRLYEEFCK